EAAQRCGRSEGYDVVRRPVHQQCRTLHPRHRAEVGEAIPEELTADCPQEVPSRAPDPVDRAQALGVQRRLIPPLPPIVPPPTTPGRTSRSMKAGIHGPESTLTARFTRGGYLPAKTKAIAPPSD